MEGERGASVSGRDGIRVLHSLEARTDAGQALKNVADGHGDDRILKQQTSRGCMGPPETGWLPSDQRACQAGTVAG